MAGDAHYTASPPGGGPCTFLEELDDRLLADIGLTRRELAGLPALAVQPSAVARETVFGAEAFSAALSLR